jgi:hypothetical protein
VRVKADQLADIDHLMTDLNHHEFPNSTKTTWEKLKFVLREIFVMPGEIMEEVVDDNIREELETAPAQTKHQEA